jgi:ferrous iron transport protein B
MHGHSDIEQLVFAAESCVILAGQPNVGKSVLFKQLTGRYVTVSNYPGTTVEVAHGQLTVGATRRAVLDAPGLNSLQPLAADEDVTRRLLLHTRPHAVVQVGDAKNLARTLFLTLQFGELDIPLVLDLNMADEARQQGLAIEETALAARLGVEVVPTVATRGTGVARLVASLDQARVPALTVDYGPVLEAGIAAVTRLLPADQRGTRGLALLLLAGDPALAAERLPGPTAQEALARIRREAQDDLPRPLAHVITQRRWQTITAIIREVVRQPTNQPRSWRERAGRWAVHPVAGWPILLLVLVLLYKFVGEFGAGTLVNLIEGRVFGEWIVPALTRVLDTMLPIPLLRDLLVGEYGLVSVGLAYGFGIVLPIVTTFFLVFGFLEDSGYLPRLAVLVHRSFRVLGLNGKAVLPMVLGLGCVTMAMMTTRILGTRKERLIATLLLALSIPCSAQLGVILAMAGGLSGPAILVWLGVMLGVLLLVGGLAARVLPGETADFILELPPLRWPQWDNLLYKTLARLEWYLKEVIPLFLGATLALFILARTGLLAGVERLMTPLVVDWLGLPAQTAGMFLLGFLRRDYGAAGLFAMTRGGLLTSHQVLVSLVVITLFVPCIASVMMMVKEQGWRRAVGVVAFVFPFAFLVGGLVHRLFGGF